VEEALAEAVGNPVLSARIETELTAMLWSDPRRASEHVESALAVLEQSEHDASPRRL
jgi:hypothetical protein